MIERLEKTYLNSREYDTHFCGSRSNMLDITYDYLASYRLRLDPFSLRFSPYCHPHHRCCSFLSRSFHVVGDRRLTRAFNHSSYKKTRLNIIASTR